MNSLSQIAPLFGVEGFINFSARLEALLGIERKRGNRKVRRDWRFREKNKRRT